MSTEDAKPCPKCHRLAIKYVKKNNGKEISYWFCEVCSRRI